MKKDWIGTLICILIILLFIGLGITVDIYRWHAAEKLIGHKMGFWEYNFLFGGRK